MKRHHIFELLTCFFLGPVLIPKASDKEATHYWITNIFFFFFLSFFLFGFVTWLEPTPSVQNNYSNLKLTTYHCKCTQTEQPMLQGGTLQSRVLMPASILLSSALGAVLSRFLLLLCSFSIWEVLIPSCLTLTYGKTSIICGRDQK